MERDFAAMRIYNLFQIISEARNAMRIQRGNKTLRILKILKTF